MTDNREKEMIRTNAKEIYDNIIIPTELEDVVKKAIASKDKEVIDKEYRASHSTISVIMKYMGAAAAVLILSVIVGLNSNETFAREMSELPVFGSVAEVFTVRKYAVKEEQVVEKEEPPVADVDITEDMPAEELPVTVSENSVQETEDTAEQSVSENSLTISVSGNDSAESGLKMVSENDVQEQSVSENDLSVEKDN